MGVRVLDIKNKTSNIIIIIFATTLDEWYNYMGLT